MSVCTPAYVYVTGQIDKDTVFKRKTLGSMRDAVSLQDARHICDGRSNIRCLTGETSYTNLVFCARLHRRFGYVVSRYEAWLRYLHPSARHIGLQLRVFLGPEFSFHFFPLLLWVGRERGAPLGVVKGLGRLWFAEQLDMGHMLLTHSIECSQNPEYDLRS